MKSTNYRPIDVPINLHLEFDQITVGELSSILRQWQALLRSAWRESYEFHYSSRVPPMRLLAASASAENSFEILSDIAIPVLYFNVALLGPARDWPSVVRSSYRYLASVWLQKRRRFENIASGHMLMRGGDSPEIFIDIDILSDNETGQRIERMWNTANSGLIKMTVEVPSDRSDDSLSE